MAHIKKIVSFILVMMIVMPFVVFSSAADQPTIHQNYINGSTDGLFHPDDTINRAEVAQIFYNLRPDLKSSGKMYADIKKDAWYEEAVISLASSGIISGYSDGTFKPMRAVTRAEFVSILSALYGSKNSVANTSFSDVPATHWAYSAIALAESMGWVKGSNGLFRPDDSLTRAEAVTAINRFLERSADKTAADLDPTVRYFPDVTPDKWFYYDVMEAAVAHTASITPTAELWTGITRYPTILPNGFAVISEKLRLIKNGWFVCEEGFGEFRGISYYSDKHGALKVQDGAYSLSGGSVAIIMNNAVVTTDGLYCMPDGLYCIKNGVVLSDGSYEGLYFGKDGRYTSGNPDIDTYIDGIVSSVVTDDMDATERLRACYDYIYYNVDYRANNNHVPRGSSPEEWTEEYMLRLIDTGKGNCYCYAAFMYYLARRVGWTSARAVSGGVTPDNLDHGWCTVIYDGEELLLDPELDASSGPYPGSEFMVTYDNAPFRYIVGAYN